MGDAIAPRSCSLPVLSLRACRAQPGTIRLTALPLSRRHPLHRRRVARRDRLDQHRAAGSSPPGSTRRDSAHRRSADCRPRPPRPPLDGTAGNLSHDVRAVATTAGTAASGPSGLGDAGSRAGRRRRLRAGERRPAAVEVAQRPRDRRRCRPRRREPRLPPVQPQAGGHPGRVHQHAGTAVGAGRGHGPQHRLAGGACRAGGRSDQLEPGIGRPRGPAAASTPGTRGLGCSLRVPVAERRWCSRRAGRGAPKLRHAGPTGACLAGSDDRCARCGWAQP